MCPSANACLGRTENISRDVPFFKSEHCVLLLLSRSAEANKANKVQ